MILRRLGRKEKLLPLILPHFPKHDIYFEPFFGSGSAFFGKPLARINYLNDNDSQVFNLWKIFFEGDKAKIDRLYNVLLNAPYDRDVFHFWKRIETEDEILKAAKFLILSNYSFLGNMGTFRLDPYFSKKQLIQNYVKLKDFLLQDFSIQTTNVDFRKFFKDFSLKDKNRPNTFAYLDPPYLGTASNYQDKGWNVQDTTDLLDIMANCGFKCLMSEFANPAVIELAKKRNFDVIEIGERRSLGSRNTEILIGNYELKKRGEQKKLF